MIKHEVAKMRKMEAEMELIEAELKGFKEQPWKLETTKGRTYMVDRDGLKLVEFNRENKDYLILANFIVYAGKRFEGLIEYVRTTDDKLRRD